jgi:transglutaminase-like putative cysteine protease
MLTQWLDSPNQLPRDSRDTLFMLFVIAWVLTPQIGHLPLWCSLMAASALAYRGYLAWHTRPLPSKWLLRCVLVLTVAATLWTHKTLLGQDAGVTLVVVLLALKTLELRAKRDAFVVFFLSFFLMLTNFFYSQSLLTAGAMLVALMGLLTALVNAHKPVGKPPLLQSAKTAGAMALWGAPIMVLLFVLFPRMAPLWGMPSDGMSGRSGLSSSMQVGNIASLALDDSIALLVRFSGEVPEQSDLYFRGPVLSDFDGKSWTPMNSSFPTQLQLPADLRVQGTSIGYQVTLKPSNHPWLLTLDATQEKPLLTGYETRMSRELQWLTDRPIGDLVRYNVQSHTEFTHGPLTYQLGLQDYLNLPAGFNPRTMQWATELRAQVGGNEGANAKLVDRVMEHLRTGGYIYTLEPGLYGRNSADEFWFDRKLGFCEHIASSFVIMMRALDIPARVVTGYQGGERNAVDGFWVVRQSDAHAWTEVWLSGRGWVRVDPTSAVAPGRTGMFQRLQREQSAIGAALLGNVNAKFALNLRAYWDAANNSWNQWVLNYTQGRQLKLLETLGFDSPNWEDLIYVLIGVVVVASLGAALWSLWERHHRDPWLDLLARATARLRQSGVDVAPNSPPRRVAELLGRHLGPDHPGLPALQAWLLQLEALRYAQPAQGQSGATGLATLKRTYKLLPWPT